MHMNFDKNNLIGGNFFLQFVSINWSSKIAALLIGTDQ